MANLLRTHRLRTLSLVGMLAFGAPQAAQADIGVTPELQVAPQQGIANPVPGEQTTLPPGVIVGAPGPFVAISLKDAIAAALSHNTDLAISEGNQRIAHYEVIKAKGPFDLTLRLAPSFSYEKIPAVSPFQAGPNGGPSTQLSTGLQAGLSATSLHGTQYAVDLSMQRIANNSTANSYDPYYPTALSFTVMRPIGQGRYTADRRDLALAIQTNASDAAQALVTASQTVANVENTYWDLVAAWRNLGIQEQALHQITAQALSNERLAHRGASAPVDVVEANTQVAVYEDNVYAAIERVASLQNTLKGAILNNPLDPLWNVNLVPTSSVDVLPQEPNLEHIVVSALVHRPEVSTWLAEKARADVQLAYAHDQLKPKLNLALGYTANGFAGENGNINQNPLVSGFGPVFSSLNQLITIANQNLPANQQLSPLAPFSFMNPPNTVGRFGTSFSSLCHNTYPTYTAQLNLALPLRNDSGRGALGIAVEQERQASIDETALLQRFVIEARNAIQALDAARARLHAAQRGRLSAERVLLSEQRRFAVGRSTTFLVLQREVEAANDQGRELSAQTDVKKALVELERVSGTIFEAHGISVQQTSAPVLSHLLHEIGGAQ